MAESHESSATSSSLKLILWGLLGCLVLPPVVFYLFWFFSAWWPPIFIERPRQRLLVEERVATAGGWNILRKDAQSYVANYQEGFRWFFGRMVSSSGQTVTNQLPSALAKLQPVFVGAPNLACHVIDIQVFGQHSTGGHSTPRFGLEIFYGTNLDVDLAQLKSQNPNQTYIRVAEGIYEKY